MDKENKHIDNDLLTRFLAGETNPEEQGFVNSWRSASPENAKLFDDLKQVWSAMDKTTTHRNIDVDAEWKLHTTKYNPQVIRTSKTISLRTTLSIAASILVLVGFTYFGWQLLSQKSIKSGIAQTNEIKLPDGSKVTLNAGSKLTYSGNYGKEIRSVTLQGEAYFEVQKNPELPFIIKVNEAEIKVLGTSFNVKAYKNQPNIEVTVTEGKVGLYKAGNESKKIVIVKGEKAVYAKTTNLIEKQVNNNRNYISWKTRYLVFDNDSLENIVKTLNSVYHKEFILTDAKLKHCPVTTVFENKELPVVLKILKETLDITIEEKDGKIYISGKGC